MTPPLVSIRVCVRTFVALLLLLGATVAANSLDLGAYGLAAALSLAVAKAALIGLFFMEIRYRKPITWLFAGAALVWLGIMLGLTMNDYITRPWSKQAWKSEGLPPLHMEFKPAEK